MTQADAAANSSSLLVPAPVHHHDLPAAGLHAVVEPLLANTLGAAMGARL
jgi:hypothetical protein